jgi:hypothetical protein
MADKQFSKAPASSAKAQSELDKVEKQFEQFEESVKAISNDPMNKAPMLEQEPQTKLSQKEIAKNNGHYLKPLKIVSDAAGFNEKYRKDWDYAKEYVNFIAEHKEIIGEKIEVWTHPFAGVPAEYWEIPPGKPVWGPRYLAEQLKRCHYQRLVMEDRQTGTEGNATFYGTLVAANTVQRIDANPVGQKRSVFMGASGF